MFALLAACLSFAHAQQMPAATTGDSADAVLWKATKQSDKIADYETYLKQYPKGEHAAIARMRLSVLKDEVKWKAEATEESAWLEAEGKQTTDGYAAYLTRYPNGRFAALAQQHSNKVKQDAADAEENQRWQNAENGSKVDTEAYLMRYPHGRYVKGAKLRLAWIQKLEAGMRPGKVFKDCPDCPEMVVIPAGNFEMGGDNARPVHTVSFARPFAMAKTEITQRQWRAMMGTSPSKFADCDECPVEEVSWNDTQRFVNKLSRITGMIYRLPSEAEWEYACRADWQQDYCGGNNVDSVAWHGAALGSGNSDRQTHPVAQKLANAFGLHDMSGNVWEWVEDCEHASYDGAPLDGSAWTDGECKYRVLRGGSWLSATELARADFRLWRTPDSQNHSYGLRPVWRLP